MECIKGDCENGMGTMLWKDGTVYAGGWQDNLMNGSGVMRYTNGIKYSGQWKNGMMNGKGEITYADGKSKLGQWEGNQMVREIIRAKKGSEEPTPKPVVVQVETEYIQEEAPAASSISPDNNFSEPVIADNYVDAPIENAFESRSTLFDKPPQKKANRPFDTTPPVIEVIHPKPSNGIFETMEDRLNITISARDASGIYKVTINGQRMTSLGDNRFETEIGLKEGENLLKLTVIDKAFNTLEDSIMIIRFASTSEN